MKLKLKNVGLIEKGEIDLKGITTIAAENNSGKSTIGKSIFTLLYSVNHFKIKFLNDLEERFSNNLLPFILLSSNEKEKEEIENIRNNFSKILKEQLTSENIIPEEFEPIFFEMENISEKFNKKIQPFFEELLSKNRKITFEELKNVLKYEKIRNTIFERFFQEEFETSIVNLFSKNDDSSIEFKDNDNLVVNVEFNKENKIKKLHLDSQIIKKYDVIYIESPILLDYIGSSRNFEEFKKPKLSTLTEYITSKKRTDTIDDILNIDKEYDKILFKIEKEIAGNLVYDNKNRKIMYKTNGKEIGIKNVATGIKSLGILEILLTNKRLNKNTILIIDEPEVHLHPKWQIKYAEFLILISKKIGVKILLNSHSPYFIRALDLYGKYYKYDDYTDFYTLDKDEENGSTEIKEAKENLSDIFSVLMEPYDELENLLGEINDRC